VFAYPDKEAVGLFLCVKDTIEVTGKYQPALEYADETIHPGTSNYIASPKIIDCELARGAKVWTFENKVKIPARRDGRGCIQQWAFGKVVPNMLHHWSQRTEQSRLCFETLSVGCAKFFRHIHERFIMPVMGNAWQDGVEVSK
jgi:hypothetical protein